MSCVPRFKQRPSPRVASRPAGFTLVEMAVVVVIAGLIITALLPALQDMRRSTQLTATQTNLQSLLRATAAYALANGCLPCPTAGNKISGSERGKVSTPGNTACGICAVADGIAPYASLGIDPATAKDGWGRWITMHVDTSLTNRACSDADITARKPHCLSADKMLCSMAFPSTTSPTVNFLSTASTKAAVVFVSHGANGYGAYRPQPAASTDACRNTRFSFPATTVCAPSTVEMCNDVCASTSTAFWLVDRTDRFDDSLTYADRNALISLFGSAACTTTW